MPSIESINQNNATGYHNFCFLYYTLSLMGDGVVVEEEFKSIQSCILKWDSDKGDEWAKKIADETHVWWTSTPVRERAKICISLCKNLNNWQTLEARKQMLSDMIAIAKSDGVFDETEKLFIKEVATKIGLENFPIN